MLRRLKEEERGSLRFNANSPFFYGNLVQILMMGKIIRVKAVVDKILIVHHR